MRRRVLFLNNQGLGSAGGGVTILRHLIEDLSPDHDLTILSHDAPDAAPHGVRQITLPRRDGAAGWFAPSDQATHLAAVVPAAELAAADLVIALDCHFAVVCQRLRPRRLIYLSLSCIPRQEWFGHTGPLAALRFLQYARLERAIASAADLVFASSGMHASELRRFEVMPRLRPVVLHPVFRAAAAPRARPARPGTTTILSVGRLEPVKNYAAVVEMAARLRDLPCRFVIAGGGSEAAKLGAATAAAGMQDRITFAGETAAVDALLAEADLFLHPSRYESFGIAVFEAMRAGVAPICAQHASIGCAEIMTSGTDSSLVDFRDLDLAAAALRDLVVDRDRRLAMGRAARNTAERMLQRPYAQTFRDLVPELRRPAAALAA